jgi:hypothetical protein
MSAVGGKADIAQTSLNVRFDPKRTLDFRYLTKIKSQIAARELPSMARIGRRRFRPQAAKADGSPSMGLRSAIAPLSPCPSVANMTTAGDRRCVRAARRGGGCDLAAQAQQGKVTVSEVAHSE